MRAVCEIAAEIAAWSVVGLLVWGATLSAITVADLVVGVAAAVAAGLLGRIARRSIGGQYGVPVAILKRWSGWAVVVPVAAAADLARLCRWLADPSRTQPADRAVCLQVPAGDDPEAVAWRQGAVLALSSTAGSVVVGIDPDHGELIIDRLVSGPPRLDRRVSR